MTGQTTATLLNQAWERAAAHAPFLADAGRRRPETLELLLAGDLDGALHGFRDGIDGPLSRQLRVGRDRLALAVAMGDLAGLLPFEAVTNILSTFADHAFDAAITAAIAERYDVPPQGFAAIALGKHGGGELNYSSDIDPILIFDPETLPHREREEVGEAAVRIGRRAVELLQARDADGYVFRVDLRLRPAAEVTPMAIPVEAAISHYESSALPWERAAFIRARAASGDIKLGQRFLDAIKPFVWRRSLDFGAIDELRAMSQRIREHHGVNALGPGYDLKRGRGGIREVEFFAQMHQLIHGGRDPGLRARDTLGALRALVEAGRIDAVTGDTLASAYRVLRTIEHRLQMVDDRQTHSLPTGEALDGVAALHGLSDGAALVDLLKPHVEAVGAIYDSLGDDRAAQHPSAAIPPAFADCASVERRLAEWRSGTIRAVRSPAAQAALEAALPGLLAAFSTAPDPDATLAAFDRMLVGLPSAINLFRLLEARPGLAKLLVDILSYAPALAAALGTRAALLDRLIDATALDDVPDTATLIAEMHAPDAPVEEALDRVRHIVGEHRFALGVQIVEGVSDPLTVARGYARVAEAAVTAVADAVIGDFAAKHGRIAGSELAVLALGRLGGGALTHASDLDLILLFSGTHEGESDGPKPLGATLYYNRLGQRLIAGLTAPTSVGALYEVDTRLRPSGAQGPLVVSVESFERYQRESAWTWEHMALARARPIYGSAAVRQELAGIIRSVLSAPRDRDVLRADVIKMRGDIVTHKPPTGPLDVKLQPGGLVDLEFITHFHQLATGWGLDPDLGKALGEVAPALVGAYETLTRILVTLRLVSPDGAMPNTAIAAVMARACGAENWDALMAAHKRACDEVSRAWIDINNKGNSI